MNRIKNEVSSDPCNVGVYTTVSVPQSDWKNDRQVISTISFTTFINLCSYLLISDVVNPLTGWLKFTPSKYLYLHSYIVSPFLHNLQIHSWFYILYYWVFLTHLSVLYFTLCKRADVSLGNCRLSKVFPNDHAILKRLVCNHLVLWNQTWGFQFDKSITLPWSKMTKRASFWWKQTNFAKWEQLWVKWSSWKMLFSVNRSDKLW